MDGDIGNVLEGDVVASWSRLNKKAKAARSWKFGLEVAGLARAIVAQRGLGRFWSGARRTSAFPSGRGSTLESSHERLRAGWRQLSRGRYL